MEYWNSTCGTLLYLSVEDEWVINTSCKLNGYQEIYLHTIVEYIDFSIHCPNNHTLCCLNQFRRFLVTVTELHRFGYSRHWHMLYEYSWFEVEWNMPPPKQNIVIQEKVNFNNLAKKYLTAFFFNHISNPIFIEKMYALFQRLWIQK